MAEQFEDILQSLNDKTKQFKSMLDAAKQQKIETNVKLQQATEQLEAQKKELLEATGLTDIDDVEGFVNNEMKQISGLSNDLDSVLSHINNDYTFTEDDVKALQSIVTKYGIAEKDDANEHAKDDTKEQ